MYDLTPPDPLQRPKALPVSDGQRMGYNENDGEWNLAAVTLLTLGF